MKSKRRTYEEMTNDMFKELTEKGDLVRIAKYNKKYWCRCDEDEMCTCGKPKSEYRARFLEIYRSLKKPALCFYDEWAYDEDGEISYERFRFDFQNISDYLDVDIKVNYKKYFRLLGKEAKIKAIPPISIVAGE